MGLDLGLASPEPYAPELPGRLVQRADSDASEKPLGTSITNLVIIIGVVYVAVSVASRAVLLTLRRVPVIVAASVLFFLHRRSVKRLKMEDAKDPNVGLDFGLEEGPAAGGKGGKRKSFIFGGEKNAHKPAQLSMDMNLSSPYLLPPPGTHQSQESLNSLARTFHNSEADPYRTVKEYINSETGSIKSYGGSKHTSVASKSLRTPTMPPRQNSMPKSSNSPDGRNPFATPTQPKPTHQPDGNNLAQPIVPEMSTVAHADDTDGRPAMPEARPPAAAHANADSLHLSAGSNGSAPAGNDGANPSAGLPGLGLNFGFPQPGTVAPAGTPNAVAGAPGQAQSRGNAEPPQIGAPQHPDDDARGRPMQRRPWPDSNGKPRGLGVPQRESKRLSVGFRPLPPDEVTESEDPEYRANRIRSFYKEYFEESKEAPPPLPTKRIVAAEDQDEYDAGYLGEAAYYDADTNAFVIPYAQPVTRRAMTPPPANRFRDGPGGPHGRGSRGPHGMHGSIGGMSAAGGPRGRPRAGSAIGPRPDSSASARLRGMPKKRLPPPADLKTLPTPAKLKDDSFAILNAIDFAPPSSFRDHVAGRSQSPLGERRAYQPKVPVASPLATAFDELPVLPSP